MLGARPGGYSTLLWDSAKKAVHYMGMHIFQKTIWLGIFFRDSFCLNCISYSSLHHQSMCYKTHSFVLCSTSYLAAGSNHSCMLKIS